ncbi:MAG: F0F1 ATP synthase subunit B [Clostridiaceae bacterium]
MEFNVTTIVMTIVNFFILMFFLRRFLFDKVNGAIENRANEVKSTIDQANADRADAAALKSENQEKLLMAKEEGKAIVSEFKLKAEKVSEDIVKEANKEAQAIIERAKKEAERQKEKLVSELREETVNLALLLSSKALEKSINEEEHRRLIQDFIKVGI